MNRVLFSYINICHMYLHTRASRAEGVEGAISPSKFWEFCLLSQKYYPKTLKFGSFYVFPPPIFVLLYCPLNNSETVPALHTLSFLSEIIPNWYQHGPCSERAYCNIWADWPNIKLPVLDGWCFSVLVFNFTQCY